MTRNEKIWCFAKMGWNSVSRVKKVDSSRSKAIRVWIVAPIATSLRNGTKCARKRSIVSVVSTIPRL